MIVAVTGFSSDFAQTLVSKLQRDPSVERIIGIDINEIRADSEKIQFIKSDVRDMDRMTFALQQVDVLFHLAFIVAPPKLPPKKTIYDINVNGSKTVFKAAAKNQVKKIIHLSSLVAYGHQPESPPIVTEESPRLGIKTTNFYYSHTKALVEEFLDQFEEEHPDIALIRVRPPVIAGHNYLADTKALLCNGKKSSKMVFPLNHNGKVPLQLVHVEDLTDVLLLIMNKEVRGAFNVAADPIADMCAFMKNEYDHEIFPASYGVMNFFLGLEKIWTKMGWIQAQKYISMLNADKVKKEFDWQPKFSTEQCLRDLLGPSIAQ